MAADPRLRQIPFFDGLDDADLERICQGVFDVALEPGEVLFREGDDGDAAYVVVSGEVEVLLATSRRDVRVATRVAGDVVGEIALLYSEPRSATLRAIGPVELLAIPKSALDEVLETSATAARNLFHTLGSRLRELHQETRQSQRMAELGTLAVGVAHELNNPAAGVQRAAQQLRQELDRVVDQLSDEQGSAAKGRRLAAPLLNELGERRLQTAALSALQRSTIEDEVEQWLEAKDVPEAWDLAAGLVDAGVQVEDLDRLGDGVAPDALAAGMRFIAGASRLGSLADSIVEGAARLSSIVGALKRHNFTDQAPVVAVDVVRGIEDTLLLLGHKVRQVTVMRDFAPDVPTIEGYGSDLNQVWTNLIDNACDALIDGEVDTPTLRLAVRPDAAGDGVVVEVEDNGPGIPPDVRDRIFDAFFTTKPQGKGTGLGLQISARIILEHDGDIDVTSEPGRTTFRVRVPGRPPAGPPEHQG